MWSPVARVADEVFQILPRASNVGMSHSSGNPIIKTFYVAIPGMDNQRTLAFPLKL